MNTDTEPPSPCPSYVVLSIRRGTDLYRVFINNSPDISAGLRIHQQLATSTDNSFQTSAALHICQQLPTYILMHLPTTIRTHSPNIQIAHLIRTWIIENVLPMTCDCLDTKPLFLYLAQPAKYRKRAPGQFGIPSSDFESL